MTRRIVRLTSLAVAAAAAVLLAGCQMPGTAAMVNGERISDRTVTEFVLDQNAMFPDGTLVGPKDGLIPLTFGKIAFPLARELGMDVSAEEALARVNERREYEGAEPVKLGDVSQGTIDVYRAAILAEKLQDPEIGVELATALQGAIEAAVVEVNPRYGLQGTEGALFEPAVLPWIAAPAG